MTVQARHVSQDFPAAAGGSLFFDGYGGQLSLSELTCNYGFTPRKRPRQAVETPAAPAIFLEGQRALLEQAATQEMLTVPAGDAACTSGRVVNGAVASPSQGTLSRPLYYQGMEVEIDSIMRLESERMRVALADARRRHARALLAAAEGAAAARLRAAEAKLEGALRRTVELEDKARQMAAECQAWMGVAKSHEAVAAGLRATVDQLLQSPSSPRGAEDARSCCSETPAGGANDDYDVAPGRKASAARRACRSCAGGEARVLLLPCRHLCLCPACAAAVDTCPVCAAAKNASLHVLFS